MSTMLRLYDVVLMGATGFTGELAFEYLVLHYFGPSAREKVSFAIAGRNEEKLKEVRSRLAEKLSNTAVNEIPIITVDSHDDDALDAMTKTTRCVMSTVGPFLLHGSPLVKACATNGTSYCDITGETIWVKKMADLYGDLAKQNKCRIVSLCGFDCIPSDLGAYLVSRHMRSQLGARPERVNAYILKTKGGVSGGTIASILNIFSQPDVMAQAKEMGSPYELIDRESRPTHRQPDYSSVSYEDDVGKTTTLWIFGGTNIKSVMKTAHDDPELYSPTLKYREKVCVPTTGWNGYFQGLSVKMGLGLVFASIAIPFTRPLVRMLAPKPGTGPSEEERENGKLLMEFYGYKVGEDGEEETTPCVKATIKMHRDPGYAETAKMLTECAIALSAGEDLASPFGAVTPVTALGDILVERLIAADIELSTETIVQEPAVAAKAEAAEAEAADDAEGAEKDVPAHL